MRHTVYELAAWVGFGSLVGGAWECFGGGAAAMLGGVIVLVVALVAAWKVSRDRGG